MLEEMVESVKNSCLQGVGQRVGDVGLRWSLFVLSLLIQSSFFKP